MRFRSFVRVAAVAVVLAMVAAACSKSNNTTQSTGPKSGGKLVVAAEQWPTCLNPTTECRSSSWLFYTVLNPTMPLLIQWTTDGKLGASPIITEVPSTDNGGITQDPFTVTYHLKPGVKWDDGTPMTSADIEFTWKALLNTTGTIDTVGYDKIKSIDTTDPSTIKIVFTQVVVDWPDLFGGSDFGFLEKAAFPKEMNAAKPDLSKEMIHDIPFSGGPWVLSSWDPTQAVLTPNKNYAGPVALLDQVTMVPRIIMTTEVNSLLSGEVAAIYPQPPATSLADQFSSNKNVVAKGSNSTYTEALWFQVKADAAVNDPKVREAISYAVDRQAVIDTIVKLNNPSAAISNCGMLNIPGTIWCDPTTFAGYTYDPAKAKSILTSDGYDCTGATCTKGGKPLTIAYTITQGNDRRAATAQLIKEKAAAAGITFNIQAKDPGQFFQDLLPKGQYEMSEYASGGYYDPSVTSSFSCDQIPPAPGGNFDYWCNQQATDLMKQADQEVDETKRVSETQQIGKIEAQGSELPALPLFNLPNVWAYRSDLVAGPVGKWGPTNYGLFFNMNEWYIP
jgi:peptide/nickel transport system substrate-binding protein